MADYAHIQNLTRATAYDVDGNKIGSVKDVYLDDTTGQPDFVTISHGILGIGARIVPLHGHTLRDNDLHLAFSKSRIETAPELSDNGHLTTADQKAFYRHYGLENTQNDMTPETNRDNDGTPL
ncbi:PRC-barrel domain-containing protein [Corynebacterium mayonis]|uniref:PRC-barrel domain-containing protein n=1 Tax=Corynebacterium mayonis TaxID=3062461 RepID=UPI0031406BBE